MSKVATLLSNIFTRSRRLSLETDAVPVSDDNRRYNQNQNNHEIMHSSSNENFQELSDTLNSNNSNNNNSADTILSSTINNLNSSNESISRTTPRIPITEITPVTTMTTTHLPPTLNNIDNGFLANNLNSNQIISTSEANESAATNNNSLAINHTQGHVVYQFANINGLHIGPVINYTQKENETKQNQNYQKNKFKPRTRTIQKMMESKEPLNHKIIDIISKHLGEGWKDIMRTLKFSDGQIHQAIFDFETEGLKEVKQRNSIEILDFF